MGGAGSGKRGNYKISMYVHNNKEKMRTIIDILQFDWNSNNQYSYTIEEIIMKSIANDAGDLLNPHSAHILFSEFKKFIFLNAMYIMEGAKDKTLEVKTYNRVFSWQKSLYWFGSSSIHRYSLVHFIKNKDIWRILS